MGTLYDVLGIDASATEEEIRIAIDECREKYVGTSQQMLFDAARETLLNEEKRQQYDVKIKETPRRKPNKGGLLSLSIWVFLLLGTYFIGYVAWRMWIDKSSDSVSTAEQEIQSTAVKIQEARVLCKLTIAQFAGDTTTPGAVSDIGSGNQFMFIWPNGNFTSKSGTPMSASCSGSYDPLRVATLSINGQVVVRSN